MYLGLLADLGGEFSTLGELLLSNVMSLDIVLFDLKNLINCSLWTFILCHVPRQLQLLCSFCIFCCLAFFRL